MPYLSALVLLATTLVTTHVPPAFAGNPPFDGPGTVAVIKDLANQLQLDFSYAAQTGGKLDFVTPPVPDQFARVFDANLIAALPPPQPADLPWLMDWTTAATDVLKSILYFGISPPVDPVAAAAAIKRNAAAYEDQESAAMSFLIRLQARDMQALSLFMDRLPPEQRTPVRMEGYNKARVANAETVLGGLITIAQGLKSANARLLSAAIADTRDVWAKIIQPADRPTILAALAKAENAAKDDAAQKNLASFGAALAAEKD